MLVYLGCLQEGVGKVLEGRDGEVLSRNGDLEQPCCLLLAQRCSQGGDGGDGTRTPEPGVAMPELAGRGRAGAGSISTGDQTRGLVKLRLGCPVVW